MTKTIIFAIIGVFLIGILATSSFTFAQIAPTPADMFKNTVSSEFESGAAEFALVVLPAIPDWVDQNFRWYSEGLIEQSELVNAIKYLIDNDILILDPERANTINQLREENLQLRIKLGEQIGEVEVRGWDYTQKESTTSGFIKLGDIKGEVDESAGEMYIPLILKTISTQIPEDEIVIILMPLQVELDRQRGAFAYSVSVKNSIDNIESPTSQWSVLNMYENPTYDPELFDEDSLSKVKVKFPWMSEEDIDVTEPNGIIIILDDDSTTFDYDQVGRIISYQEASELIDEILNDGMATEDDWEDAINQIAALHGIDTTDSVVDDLQGIVVLCSTPIEKELEVISTELEYIDEWLDIISQESADTTERSTTERYTEETTARDADLNFMELKLRKINSKIISVQIGLDILDGHSQGTDLENKIEELQMTSNLAKADSDAKLNAIRNIRS